MPENRCFGRWWRAPAWVVVALIVCGLGAAAAGAQGYWPSWPGEAGGVFRTGGYDHGQWIYTNGIHQAQGANSDLLHRTDYFRAVFPAPGDPTFATRDLYNALTYDFFGSHRAAHNGDYQLPNDAAHWPEGTADLAELRLAADADYLYVRFLWNAFPRAGAQIATLTFAKAGSGVLARPWPRNARLASGWQAALTVWGSGASLTTALAGEVPLQVRSGDHVTQARIPLSLLPAGPWSLAGGSGLQDPAASGSYWTVPPGSATATHPGSGAPLSSTNVWDLLFAGDQPWSFDERRQADELSSGSAASSTATVDPAILQHGGTDPGTERTGDISRMFASRLFTADGTRNEPGVGADTQPPAGFKPPIPTSDFDRTFLYTGRLQYYGMHVPARYPTSAGAWPLIVYLHGFTGLPDEAFYNPVGLVKEADRRGYLVATPLGRGDYFYRGEGDLDVLEVIRDVERHYRVDPSRIYLMGHSMGGYGTNNVATHHPDLFAAVAPAEGTDSIPLHGNLRNLPWFELSAIEDLDAGAAQAKTMYGALSADGYDARLLVYTTKIHEYSSIYDTLPQLFGFFAAHRRQLDPGIVTWTRPTGQDRPDLGLIYDGAYWLHGVQAQSAAKPATVTVTSNEIRHAQPDPVHASRSDQTVDTAGPSGRGKGELLSTVPAAGHPVASSNSLRIDSSGVSALHIDGHRARVGFAKSKLTIRANTDAPLRLSLTGLMSASGVLRIDGHVVRHVQTRGGAVTVLAPQGRHTLVLSRSAATGLPGCPLASGRLTSLMLGPVALGMTRARARRAFSRSSTHGRLYVDYFCLTPQGIRVGYPSPAVLAGLAPRTRNAERDHVVLALTANPYYALRDVRAGMRLASVARELGTGTGYQIGLNTWYLTAAGPGNGVLKVRHGRIEEIGIADKRFTRSRSAAARFLNSFR